MAPVPAAFLDPVALATQLSRSPDSARSPRRAAPCSACAAGRGAQWVDGSLRDGEWYRQVFSTIAEEHSDYQIAIFHVVASDEEIHLRAKRRGEVWQSHHKTVCQDVGGSFLPSVNWAPRSLIIHRTLI